MPVPPDADATYDGWVLDERVTEDGEPRVTEDVERRVAGVYVWALVEKIDWLCAQVSGLLGLGSEE